MNGLFNPPPGAVMWKGLQRGTWLSILLVLLLVIPAVTLCYLFRQNERAQNREQQATYTVIQSLSKTQDKLADAIAGQSAMQADIRSMAIDAQIRTVFGSDAPKAFKLLSCENGRLNPKALNVNTDGSKDYGVFQINNKWQGVSNEAFLFDPSINIRIAYNIYHRSGDTFKMWSCGERMGL